MFIENVKYYFVHRYLPGYIFNDEDVFIKVFIQGKNTFYDFLNYAWNKTENNILRNENKRRICNIEPEFKVHINEISSDVLMGIIRIPEPDVYTEVLCVGFTFGNCNVRYFIYELGMCTKNKEKRYFINERIKDGEQYNHNSYRESDISNFIGGVKELVAS